MKSTPRSTRGACVGRPVSGMEVRIIPISDQPVPALEPAGFLKAGSVGEIIVKGPVVTREYDGLPEATAAAKIADPAAPGGVWHRMGDCGALDESGRLWFCGRKAERVETAEGTLFTEPCEQVFRPIPARGAARSSASDRVPALVAETRTQGRRRRRGPRWGAPRRLRFAIRTPQAWRSFISRPDLPVDVRHNAKIHRLALARWAATATAHRAEGS